MKLIRCSNYILYFGSAEFEQQLILYDVNLMYIVPSIVVIVEE